jgi:integrase
VLWRAGLRVQEALALSERDLDARRGSLLVRRGKGGRRREIGIDEWGWEELRAWLAARVELPVDPLFASSTVRVTGDPGQAPPSAASFADSPARPVSGAGSRRTSCGTLTPSSSPAKACR